jgi:hypothetical protein
MKDGLSLVELMVALACSSLVMLGAYRMYIVSTSCNRDMHDAWCCMQSLRVAAFELHRDLMQRACLMPQDMEVRVKEGELFVAGIPSTSQHDGIQVSRRAAPPYYAVITASEDASVTVDTADIDLDGRADFWASLGVITDECACVIRGDYQRGRTRIPLRAAAAPLPGERIVPAVHYELRTDGLYRNGQIASEAVTSFEPRIDGAVLKISMEARSHDTVKEMHLSCRLR